MFNYVIRTILLCSVFLSACDSGTNSVVQPQSSTAANTSNIAFAIPERIRTSQAVNLDATRAVVTYGAETLNLTRNGDQFTGSVVVEPGSIFSYTITVYEMVGGQRIDYLVNSGRTDQQVNADFTITLRLDQFIELDDDSDGASNLTEREAGSDHMNSASTPANPEGITEDNTNPGILRFTANSYSVAESDGDLTVSVQRTGGSDGRVSVRYEFKTETAVIGRDFESSTGELVWEDGDTTPQDIQVVVRTDNVNDGEQTFTAHLFAPAGGVAISNGFARITLLDSTPPAQRGTIQLVSNRVSVDEDAGQVELEVERVNGSDGLVTVDFMTTEGTATDADFTAIAEPRTIRWADGEDGSRTIRIRITNDNESEPEETFSVDLSNPLGGASLGLATTSVAINDTTPVPVPGQLALAESSYTVLEGGSVNVVIDRLEGADGSASVDFTISAGTADEDDFSASTAASGTLSWANGDTGPRSITINALTDSVIEADETVVVTLENATGAALGTASTATITINDATLPTPGVISLNATTSSVDEGDSVELDVSRNGGSNGEVSVSVTSAASTGYSVTPATLIWADGDTEDKTITLTALTDDIVSDTETIDISLTDATGGATIDRASVTVTINDTSVPSGPGFLPLATDGQWEVCIPPFNTTGPSAFATQLSATEGRIVSCIKTCDESIIRDPGFPGWGWNPIDLHSCVANGDAPGTYTTVPIYTPTREAVNLDINARALTRGNSIWSCVTETRQNAEFNYTTDQTNTIWYQFLDDGTYFYGSTTDNTQPDELLGPDVWSVDGRILELGHINRGYRNTLFFPGNQTLHIHPTTDDRLSCTRQVRPPTPVPPVAVPETDPEVEPDVDPEVE